MKRDFLKTLNVEKPCAESWDEMRGDDKMRFCKHCAETVNNISEMTTREIEKLAAQSNGKLCVRYIRNADKQIITKSTPQNFTPTIKRISQFAAGIFIAVLSVLSIDAQSQKRLPSVFHEDKRIMPANDAKLDVETSQFFSDIKAGDRANIIKLIENKEFINRKDLNGSGVLYLVSDAETAKLLIEYKSDVNSRNINGETPLMYAFDAEIARVLIDAGANVNAASNFGNTPLMFAMMVKDFDVAKFLIKRGASVNKNDVEGRTALIFAVYLSDFQKVKLLVDSGANVNARDNEGKSVLKYALESSSKEIVEYLKNIGAVE